MAGIFWTWPEWGQVLFMFCMMGAAVIIGAIVGHFFGEEYFGPRK